MKEKKKCLRVLLIVFRSGKLFVARTQGLMVVDVLSLKWSFVSGPWGFNTSFTSVAVMNDTVAAGTADGLVWRNDIAYQGWHFFRTPGIIDATANALLFVNGSLWVVNDVCVNIQKPDLTFHRVGGREGLPVTNITSIASDGSNVWLGTQFGLVLFAQDRFQFLGSARFLVGTDANIPVLFVTTFNGAAIVATKDGYSIVSRSVESLDEKAIHFSKMLMKRHRYTSDPSIAPRLAFSMFVFFFLRNEKCWIHYWLHHFGIIW